MPVLGHAPRYHAYVLRCWAETPGVWRFSVENPHTGERRGFGDMPALMAFLEATLCQEDDTLASGHHRGGRGEAAAAPTEPGRSSQESRDRRTRH